MCVETGKVYPSIASAALAIGVHETAISKCCNGDLTQAGGFRWEYLEPTRNKKSSKSEESIPTISVKRCEDGSWEVFYKETLLKSFKTSSLAYTYASDSALDEAYSRKLNRSERKRRAVGRPIRHLETGKVYSSIKEASKALGISAPCIGDVARGVRERTHGQRFEFVKEDEWKRQT